MFISDCLITFEIKLILDFFHNWLEFSITMHALFSITMNALYSVPTIIVVAKYFVERDVELRSHSIVERYKAAKTN